MLSESFCCFPDRWTSPCMENRSLELPACFENPVRAGGWAWGCAWAACLEDWLWFGFPWRFSVCLCAWMGIALGSCTVLGEILVFLVSNTAGVNSSLAWGVPPAVHPILGVQNSFSPGRWSWLGCRSCSCPSATASSCKPLYNQVELRASGTWRSGLLFLFLELIWN